MVGRWKQSTPTTVHLCEEGFWSGGLWKLPGPQECEWCRRCVPLRCSTCSGRGNKTCATCKGEKKLLHFVQLVIMWYVAVSHAGAQQSPWGMWPGLVAAEKLHLLGAITVQGPAGRKGLTAPWERWDAQEDAAWGGGCWRPLEKTDPSSHSDSRVQQLLSAWVFLSGKRAPCQGRLPGSKGSSHWRPC